MPHNKSLDRSEGNVFRNLIDAPKVECNRRHVYEIRPRRDKQGVDLISDAPFGRLWDLKAGAAVGCAKFFSRSRPDVIRVFDESGNVIETHDHAGEFKEWCSP